MVCRRIYGLKRAFRDVHGPQDWRQPKGPSGAKWRSKVRWDLAQEIDWRALEADDEDIPEVEKELQGKLRDKAMAHRYLQQQDGLAEDDES